MPAKFVLIAVAASSSYNTCDLVALDAEGLVWHRRVFDPVSKAPPTPWTSVPDDRPASPEKVSRPTKGPVFPELP